MTRFTICLLIAFCAKTGAVRADMVYTPVSFASSANVTLQDMPETSPFVYTGGIGLPNSATGNQVFGGVPFYIPTAGNSQGFNGWNAQNASGSNPRVLTMTTSVYGAVSVSTLINTYFGIAGPTSYAAIEFFGAGGSFYKYNLVGGVDIRNYNIEASPATWTQTINGTSTVNVLNYDSFGLGQNLDMQTIALPASFLIDTLTTIELVDNGIDISQSAYEAGDTNFQRTVLSGVTVASVPEPTSFILLGVVAAFGFIAYRWRRLASVPA